MPRKPSEPAAKPASPRKPTMRRRKVDAAVELTWEHVATRAYYLHLEEGGDPLANWLRAESEFVAA